MGRETRKGERKSEVVAQTLDMNLNGEGGNFEAKKGQGAFLLKCLKIRERAGQN